MAYGSADSVSELDAFYTHIRGGRRPSPAQLADLQRRYEAIGGMSPLRQITERQRVAVEAELGLRGMGVPVFAAMKHAPPFIDDVVAGMIDQGIHRIVGLVLAPHFSTLSVAAYARQLEAAARGSRDPVVACEMVQSWHTEPRLIAALSKVAAEALEASAGQPHLVFTAHSLPEKILANSDPYAAQLLETSGLVAQALSLPQGSWSFAYQSAAVTSEPWLGPDLCEHLGRLSAAGMRDVVVCPIGFVADHLEILYDIDIEAQQAAAALGIRLIRARSMNDDPLFIGAIAEIVARTLSSMEASE
jgi:ferrochelatase